MPKDRKNIRTQLGLFDDQHDRRIAQYEARVAKILNEAQAEAVRIAQIVRNPKPNRVFTFQDYPQTKARIDALINQLTTDLIANTRANVAAEWDASNLKNDDLLRAMNKGQDPTPEMVSKYGRKNYAARDAFQARTANGLNISDRVWSISKQFKSEIEAAVDYGITQGIPANKLATEVQKYLKNPDKLFRRVRDKDGNLRLSKPAQAYHPGQGVYRSSYKNARRLTATETNLAYRTADFNRWADMDFVLGIEIKLSNNHTLNGKPFRDICDTLAGKYPKDYKFTGWHPLCRCRAIPILADIDDFAQTQRDQIDGVKPAPYTGYIKSLPDPFTGWIGNNAERINRSKSVPYFMTDNAKLIAAAKIRPTATAAPIPQTAVKAAAAKISTAANIQAQAQPTTAQIANQAQAIDPVHAKIVSMEEKIRMNQGFETAYALDSRGRVVMNKGGQASSVSISQQEGLLLKDSIFTHNHPGGWKYKEGTIGRIGNSFSTDDIRTAIKLDIKEIRAVTPHFTFTMKRPATGWPDLQKAVQDMDQINKIEGGLQAVRIREISKIQN